MQRIEDKPGGSPSWSDEEPAPTTNAAQVPRAGTFYRGLRAIVRAGLRTFYRTIEVTGLEHAVPGVPTIYAANHPNSIVDPLLLGTLEERQVCFCARDGLFRIPLFGRLLREVGAIPLRRRSDHGGGAVDNADAFAACREVLAKSGVLSIFPEGKTHDRLHIEPLRTGVARIALDAQRDSIAVHIVPVGLNYLVRHAYRSDVHVAFGKAIDVRVELGELARTDPAAAVKALTARVDAALRDLAVDVEKKEDERIIAQVTAIMVGIRADEGLDVGGQSPADRTALVRRVVDAYRWISEKDPDYTEELRGRIEEYLTVRARLGFGGETPALQHRGERRRWEREGRRRLAVLVAGAPLAAFGLINSMLPYLILRGSLRLSGASVDRIALVKLLGGPVIFGGCYGAQTAAVAMAAGAVPAFLYAGAVIPAGVFARWYLTSARLHRLSIRSALAFWKHTDDLALLRAERARLRDELADLRRRYLDQAGK
jgi:1-acyl-sn-glycerol-3-phosphate acyltransferase